jgi:hypothetical protein
MADPVTEVLRTWSAMGEIERIVRLTYGDPTRMAEVLRMYAQEAKPEHSIAWVVKKAHSAMSLIEWERDHVALNRAVGLADDFVG